MKTAAGAEQGGQGRLVDPDQKKRCGFHPGVRFLVNVPTAEK
jgi:hypothetical protein